jgi:hypothetical protein
MDYDLSRLSTRSFEQLIQSLAAVVISPGITVFGDGPDGAREATFDGAVAFPDPAAPWKGYGVIQAKFRHRPLGGGKDADWALAELKKDLDKFSDPKRRLRSPEYYVFATNVVLTPAAESGGKDRVAALLDEHCRNHGLAGYRIWDYDQICTFLDGQEAVRISYAAWITAGDVLAAVLERMPRRHRDFRTVMRTLVQKELRADQYVNLNQAGHRESERTPLARVFVDLPVADKPRGIDQPPAPPPTEELLFDDDDADEAPPSPTGVMSDLHALAARRLDPASAPPRRAQPDLLTEDRIPVGRIVLMGGPGQGKSTLSQFVCQVHRAALLALDASVSLPPEIADACDVIGDQCVAESLTLPSVPRFPVRVELNRFAKALADGTASSLFGYLRDRIAALTELEVVADDLHAWLGVYPWLLVLDGLDEVPASSNRTQVLDSIQDFLVDAHAANADLLLIATSRPQGYNDDFSPRYYRHRYLVPLDVPRALRYAGRLARERWGTDPDRVERVLARLERAGADPATARLMQSPLQVAIMTLLVDSTGEPPRERWRLFSDYYRVIYDRERQRDIPAARLLGDYQAEIDSIHQRVAQRLQIDSEQAGGTDAAMSEAAFAELVDRRLSDEGHEDAERRQLTAKIREAALHRLVFLVAPTDGKIGFEVRSLQEFMAAQYLTTGPDEEVRKRLSAIAFAAHWRNTFLFAAGRCFHEKQHLRDSLYALCGELNEGDNIPAGGELEHTILAGSRLALEILEDGAVARQPGQLKRYARLALRLMDLPPCDEHLRVAAQFQQGLEAPFREEIAIRLQGGVPERRLGAWRVLLQLVGDGQPWAQHLADTYWPTEVESATLIFRAVLDLPGGDWLAQRWRKMVPALDPATVSDLMRPGSMSNGLKRLRRPGEDHWTQATPGWAVSIADIDRSWHARTRSDISIAAMPKSALAIGVATMLAEDPAEIVVPKDVGPEWQWAASALNFACSPSSQHLAEVLESIGALEISRESASLRLLSWEVAWPLGACLDFYLDGTDLAALTSAARAGRLGDFDDWEQAEQRWQHAGVTAEDFAYEPDAGLPFDRSIKGRGIPARVNFLYFRGRISPRECSAILKLYRDSAPRHRRMLERSAFFALSDLGRSNQVMADLDINELRPIFEGSDDWISCDILGALPDPFWLPGEGEQFLNLLGERELYGTLDANGAEPLGARLEPIAARHPDCGGILRLLAALCRSGYRPAESQLHLEPDAYEDSRYREAVQLIRLASGSWGADEASALASELARHQERNGETVRSVLAILSHQPDAKPVKEHLMVALYDALPVHDWQAHQAVMDAMLAQQRRRLSAFPALESPRDRQV